MRADKYHVIKIRNGERPDDFLHYSHNFDQHYFIADGGMFKAVFLSLECEYLNALKLKKMFSKGIENLGSTKFLKNKTNYGFNNYPDIAGAINQYRGYFKK